MSPSGETPLAATAVSAPGKVLLAGGYLVLDRAHTGLVFGLSARINVITRDIPTMEGVHLSEIVVESPQFLEAQWRYGYHMADEGGGIKVTELQVSKSTPHKPNPFVKTALSYALTYIAQRSGLRPSHSLRPARLTILADNDYYSAPTDDSSSSAPDGPAGTPAVTPKPRFARFPTTLSGAHKTGLGSSAALVTALCASVLAHYLPADSFDVSADGGRRALHNLAQAAHCAAQGKVGSGFDVAAAVYGSCRYRRFSPAVLEGVGAEDVGTTGFAKRLVALVDDDGAGGEEQEGAEKEAKKLWDTEVVTEGSLLPDGVCLRMCDVDAGTATVGMVKKVMAWRKGPETEASAADLWRRLDAANRRLEEVLRHGGEAGAGDDASKKRKRAHEVDGPAIRAAIQAVRALQREMSADSGAEVEPESQRALLDHLTDGDEALGGKGEDGAGCFGGVCPGAGGYDALALVMRDDDATETKVKEKLKAWADEKGVVARLMGVKGEMEGTRREDVEGFVGWI